MRIQKIRYEESEAKLWFLRRPGITNHARVNLQAMYSKRWQMQRLMSFKLQPKHVKEISRSFSAHSGANWRRNNTCIRVDAQVVVKKRGFGSVDCPLFFDGQPGKSRLQSSTSASGSLVRLSVFVT